MAFEFTYTSLRQATQDWVEVDSTEFTDALDTIIGLAEFRLMRDVNILAFRKTADTSTTIGDPFLPKPCDFVTPRYLFLYDTANENRFSLLIKDTAYVSEYWNDRANDTGTPKYYANWDQDTFILAPTPDKAYKAELGYTVRPDGLSSAVATTWLSTHAPDAVLFACLLEAVNFLKEERPTPSTIQKWEESYQKALRRLALEEHFEVNTDDYRQTSIRRQVNMVPEDK